MPKRTVYRTNPFTSSACEAFDYDPSGFGASVLLETKPELTPNRFVAAKIETD